MTPIQEVDIHTSKKVLYKAQVIHPDGSATYHAEVELHDSEINPPFSSRVRFHQTFTDAIGAYERILYWVAGHASKYDYPLTHIDNPCNCEFIKKPEQEVVVNKLKLSLPIRVNGA